MLPGTIPPELGALSSLLTLDLDSNRLSGTLPAQLGKLASLSWLNLQNNRLGGTLPGALCGLANRSGTDCDLVSRSPSRVAHRQSSAKSGH